MGELVDGTCHFNSPLIRVPKVVPKDVDNASASVAWANAGPSKAEEAGGAAWATVGSHEQPLLGAWLALHGTGIIKMSMAWLVACGRGSVQMSPPSPSRAYSYNIMAPSLDQHLASKSGHFVLFLHLSPSPSIHHHPNQTALPCQCQLPSHMLCHGRWRK